MSCELQLPEVPVVSGIRVAQTVLGYGDPGSKGGRDLWWQAYMQACMNNPAWVGGWLEWLNEQKGLWSIADDQLVRLTRSFRARQTVEDIRDFGSGSKGQAYNSYIEKQANKLVATARARRVDLALEQSLGERDKQIDYRYRVFAATAMLGLAGKSAEALSRLFGSGGGRKLLG